MFLRAVMTLCSWYQVSALFYYYFVVLLDALYDMESSDGVQVHSSSTIDYVANVVKRALLDDDTDQ